MNFIGSKAYYILCGFSLISLFIGLIVMNRKRPSQNKPGEAHQPGNVPKYAAGGEMDRINKNSYISTGAKRSILSILVAIVVLAGAIFIYTGHNTATPASKELHVIAPFINTGTNDPIITNGKYPTVKITSTDYSQDLSKIFVTLTTSNETDINFYSVVTTISLLDENEITLQDEQLETIEAIKPGEEEEKTIAITINPENIGKIRKVSYQTHFYYQQI